MKQKVELIPWQELSDDEKHRFLTTFHPSNYPEDFDAVLFLADGSSYRDHNLLAEVFSIEKKG